MKKIFTLIAAAIVSLTVFAQQEVVLSPEAMVEDATIASKASMRAAMKSLAKPEPSANALAAKKSLTKAGQSTNARSAETVMTAADIVGTYVSYSNVENSLYNYEYDYCTPVKIVAGEEPNTVLITGLLWQKDEYPLKGIVKDGQLIVPTNQQLYQDETYGRISLGVIAVDETGEYDWDIYNDENHPIIFDIHINGMTLIETQFGVAQILPNTDEEGNMIYFVPVSNDLILLEPNGTMTSELAVSESDLSVGQIKTSPVYVGMGNGYATVYGFDKNFVNNIFFNTDGTCRASANKPLYYHFGNKGYTYAYKETINPTTGKLEILNNTSPEGTYADDTINLGMWALYVNGAKISEVILGHRLNSKIVLDEGVLDIPDNSVLEGTYKVDAHVELETPSKDKIKDSFEALEMKVKQNIKVGYIDITLPTFTTKEFTMAGIVLEDLEVVPSEETPGVYEFTQESLWVKVLVGGKIVNGMILNKGILDINNKTIEMTLAILPPSELGIFLVIEYSKSNNPTAISTVKAEGVPMAKKFIQNGQLIIEKNGQKFNTAGQKM